MTDLTNPNTERFRKTPSDESVEGCLGASSAGQGEVTPSALAPTQPLDLAALTVIANAATPGPWHWSGNTDNKQLYLATWIKGAGRCQVMDFERWGMQSAVPRFLDDDSLMMETAKDLVVYEVARNQKLPDDTHRNHPKVYRADVVDVRHPNAAHIAAFDPPTALALIARLENAEALYQARHNHVLAAEEDRNQWRARAEAAEKKIAASLVPTLRTPDFTGPGYEAHPGHDHEDCCK